jgi:hypothetical protein
MASGEFDGLNGEAIVICEDGRLQDGHTRLEAIIESGTTQELLVVRGAAPSAYMTQDRGVPRNNAHALEFLHGFPSSRRASAAGAAMAFYLIEGYFSGNSSSRSFQKRNPKASMAAALWVARNPASTPFASALENPPFPGAVPQGAGLALFLVWHALRPDEATRVALSLSENTAAPNTATWAARRLLERPSTSHRAVRFQSGLEALVSLSNDGPDSARSRYRSVNSCGNMGPHLICGATHEEVRALLGL